MTSRSDILKTIRGQNPPAVDLPDLARDWLRYSEPWQQFQTLLESVGGRFVRVTSEGEIAAVLTTAPPFADAKKIISRIASVTGNVNLDAVDDPHDLESVDWAVLPGQFAVAETGAVWVSDESVRQRAVYFIVQHLALVVSADQIVHNMHEAYARAALGASSLGVFVSGPSKTADIEQSLVIGAHGPRSLTVFCVG
jgi:L-lactate dehydrogenase complex protein LldG